MDGPKLYLILLGAEVPGRHVEQHDYFFGIAQSMKDLVPELKAFWPETGNTLHVDGWREVTAVDGHRISVVPNDGAAVTDTRKLFFLNLGGYMPGDLLEQHHIILTVQEDRAKAIQAAKQTVFYKTNSMKGSATAHVDEKYGVDVDEIYRIDDLLSPELKERYRIQIDPAPGLPEDKIRLGYFKLDKL